MVMGRYECGKRCFLHAYRAFHKDHQFRRSENCFRDKAIPAVPGLCDGVFIDYRFACEPDFVNRAYAVLAKIPAKNETPGFRRASHSFSQHDFRFFTFRCPISTREDNPEKMA